MIQLAIASGISGVFGLIALVIRLRHVDKRDDRERQRYETAELRCSDAYYRGGVLELLAMCDVQVDLLRATAPETRRGVIDQIRRTPFSGPQQLPQ